MQLGKSDGELLLKLLLLRLLKPLLLLLLKLLLQLGRAKYERRETSLVEFLEGVGNIMGRLGRVACLTKIERRRASCTCVPRADDELCRIATPGAVAVYIYMLILTSLLLHLHLHLGRTYYVSR